VGDRRCNKRMDGHVFRCDLDHGHRGHHECHDTEGRLAASWPSRKELARIGARPRARLKAQSDKQAIREAALAGIKAERCWSALRDHGEITCSICGKIVFEASGWGESMNEIVLAAAMESCDLHHPQMRSGGQGYRGTGDFGVDHPDLVVLVCGSCHRDEHPGPIFRREGAAA
jgi:hypothetical protein